MKITAVTAIPILIPFKPNFHFPYTLRTTTFCDHVLVRIDTDQGLRGWAEAPPRPILYGETQKSIVAAIEETLGPALIGMNPFDLEKIHARMENLRQNLAAKGAVDIALHDIMGQFAGLPVYRLLGGWHTGNVAVSWMMAILGAGKMAEEAHEFYRQGIRAFKIKVGINRREDLVNFRAIREAVGPEALLYVDGNQEYSPDDAIRVLREMERYGLAWAEEPVSIYAGARRRAVASAISVPISGDESCFTADLVAREIEAGVIGLVVIKAARTGFYQSRKIVHLCEPAGLPCLIGSQGDTGIGTLAAVHLAKAFKQIRHPIENSAFLRLEDDLLREPLVIKDGYIEISEKPGLGIEVDEKKLERYRLK